MPKFSMPWVETDFRRKTQRLTRFQRDAYRALLQACFERDGELFDSDKHFAQICDLDLRTWRKHRTVVLAFFYRCGDTWRHHRIDEDLLRIRVIHEKRSLAGQKGVVARVIRSARRH
jgi:uncharacterized protein YdaU (DUF1376 family)